VRPDPRLLALGALLLVSCKEAEQPAASTKARVLAKPGPVWGKDLSVALGLQDWELCKELGAYDCITEAHNITLGGVEPTELGIDAPLEDAAVSAPIAVDRVAVAACGERLARDEQGPAVVFGPVLEEDTPRTRREVAGNLVRRILARHPTETELSGLVDLYDTIAPLTDDPVREWSIGACMVVATSTEALFY
jgi:hypothetical protein